MAESADETSCINRWQILIGVFGLGGLVATVVYAARSAKSALETVRHMDITSRRELRAYIDFCVPSIKFEKIDTGTRVTVSVTVTNVGKTPMYKLASKIKGQIMESAILMPSITSDPGEHFAYLPPGGEKFIIAESVWDKAMAEFADPRLFFYIYGRFDFLDAFGDIQYRNFCGHIEDLAGFLSTEEKSGAIKIIWADRHNDAS